MARRSRTCKAISTGSLPACAACRRRACCGSHNLTNTKNGHTLTVRGAPTLYPHPVWTSLHSLHGASRNSYAIIISQSAKNPHKIRRYSNFNYENWKCHERIPSGKVYKANPQKYHRSEDSKTWAHIPAHACTETSMGAEA